MNGGKSKLYPLIAGFIAAFAVAAGFIFIDTTEDTAFKARQRTHVMERLAHLSNSVKSVFSIHSGALDALEGLVKTQPNVDQDVFNGVAKALVHKHFSIRQIQLSPNAIVRYLYPTHANDKGRGLDLRTIPGQGDAVERSIRDGRVNTIGPITLAQGGTAIITRKPIYTGKGDDRKFWGFATIILDYPKLLQELKTVRDIPQIDTALKVADANGQEGKIIFGDKDLFLPNQGVVAQIDVPGSRWALAIAPRNGWANHRPQRWLLIIVALLVSAFCGALAFWDTTRRNSLKFAGQEARDKSHLHQTAIDTMAQGIVVFDADLRLISCNDHFREILRLPPDLLHDGIGLEDIIRHRAERGDYGEVDVEEVTQERLERMKTLGEVTTERFLPNGTVYVYHRKPMPDGGYVFSYTDVTERKRVERALKESNERFHGAFNNAGIGITIRNCDGKGRQHNRAFCDMLGYSEKELQAIRVNELAHPDDDPKTTSLRYLSFANADNHVVERRFIRKDGTVIWCNVSYRTVYGVTGEPLYSIGMYQDITERKKAENLLRASEARYKAILSAQPDLIFQLSDEGRHLDYYSSSLEDLYVEPQKFLGKRVDEVLPADVSQIYLCKIAQTLRTSQLQQFEYQLDFGKGPRFYDCRMVVSGKNQVLAIVREITQRHESEKKLQQAQKMEAVGQLTGGIAHDFNNLLAVSLGNVELAEEIAQEGGDVRPFLETVKRANERGAALTSQLLAFSRKQTLFPRSVDAGELVASMADLLRRTLGETIEVKVSGDDGLWPCEVDPSLLESAVLNLAINARDAMPGGGRLTIATSNVSLDDDYASAQADVAPGEYVLVAVSDTGAGMPREVIEQAFDPFFTTKEVGRGSGLGLSMVYGFVKQSGGHVTIYSEEGEGTTVKLYLPRSDKPEQRLEGKGREDIPAARGETVLVVEDDPDVRALSVALLGSLGYEVLEAADGKSALEVLEAASGVDLLFTDVVLPGGMSGLELANESRTRRPSIAVLYTSGYTELGNIDHSTFGEDAELLQKPYPKAALAQKVRVALDQPSV